MQLRKLALDCARGSVIGRKHTHAGSQGNQPVNAISPRYAIVADELLSDHREESSTDTGCRSDKSNSEAAALLKVLTQEGHRGEVEEAGAPTLYRAEQNEQSR